MGTGRWGFAVATVLTAAFLCLALAGMVTRAPWLDEFLVRYFVASPGDLVKLIRGSGHPIGWYLPFLPVTRLTGDGMLWLRAIALLSVPLATAILCRPLVRNRRAWVRTLLLTAPAAAGTVIVLERGIDARPYGALTIASLLVAATLWWRGDGRPLGRRETWSLAAALTLLATTHLTGLVLTAGFVLAAGRMKLVPLRSTVAPALTASAVTTVAWWWGVQDLAAAASTLDFSLETYLSWIVDGLSRLRPVSAVLLAMWLASLTQGDRRAVWAYDVPAVMTLVLLAVISNISPAAKSYTLMPAIVLLVAGTIVRLSTMHPPIHLVALLALAANFAIHAPLLLDDFFYWGETAQFVEAHADEISCPLWAHPQVGGRLPADDLIDAVDVVPFGSDADACACNDRWFVMNHMGGPPPPPPIPETATILQAWPTAVTGRVACAE